MTPRRRQLRRGLILPITLLILLLIGLLAAGFAFRIHADRSSFNAVTYRLQTRLAAEAGIEKVLLMLRTQRDRVGQWYNNPEELNRIIVWTPEDETLWGTNEELDEGTHALRFSIVADDPFDDEERCRYGLTDESAKLNLNTATKEQLTRLIAQVAIEEDMVVEELVDALIDWRDEDDVPGEFGAEADYYASLDTPYQPKNGPFDTVEELLMVKGFDGRVLYGEDQDRNGIMTPNEDDTDESFPEDNGDGQLNRGLYPYVTVYSRDINTDRDNHQRIYLYAEAELVAEQLGEFIDDPAKVDFIVSACHGGGPQQGQDKDQQEEDKESQEQEGDSEGGPDRVEQDVGASRQGAGEGTGEDRGKRGRPRQQAIRPSLDDENDSSDANTNGPGGDRQARPEHGPGEREAASGAQQGTQFSSPADLLTAEVEGMVNPLTVEDLPILMERTTTIDPVLGQPGLVNILTAPPVVLRCLGDLTGESIAAILQGRGELSEEAQATTAWLLAEGVLSPETYAEIAPYITVRSLQFTIESLGYADHVGAISRLQVVVEMRGPVPQVLYYRDLTRLGAVFPIREDEQEYGFGGQRG